MCAEKYERCAINTKAWKEMRGAQREVREMRCAQREMRDAQDAIRKTQCEIVKEEDREREDERCHATS